MTKSGSGFGCTFGSAKQKKKKWIQMQVISAQIAGGFSGYPNMINNKFKYNFILNNLSNNIK